MKPIRNTLASMMFSIQWELQLSNGIGAAIVQDLTRQHAAAAAAAANDSTKKRTVDIAVATDTWGLLRPQLLAALHATAAQASQLRKEPSTAPHRPRNQTRSISGSRKPLK
eukprot:4734301-Amphidinium_carterae.1